MEGAGLHEPQAYDGLNVFVTGADGFIGSHLVEGLVRSGANVTALAMYNSLTRMVGSTTSNRTSGAKYKWCGATCGIPPSCGA